MTNMQAPSILYQLYLELPLYTCLHKIEKFEIENSAMKDYSKNQIRRLTAAKVFRSEENMKQFRLILITLPKGPGPVIIPRVNILKLKEVYSFL